MLSGYVSKYLDKRHTFNTENCSYTFGMGGQPEAKPKQETEPDQYMETLVEQSKSIGTPMAMKQEIKFPSSRTTKRRSMVDRATLASNETRLGDSSEQMPRTARNGSKAPIQKVFGLNSNDELSSLETAQDYRTGGGYGLTTRQKGGRETLPGISSYAKHSVLDQEKSKTATAQPMSRYQL